MLSPSHPLSSFVFYFISIFLFYLHWYYFFIISFMFSSPPPSTTSSFLFFFPLILWNVEELVNNHATHTNNTSIAFSACGFDPFSLYSITELLRESKHTYLKYWFLNTCFVHAFHWPIHSAAGISPTRSRRIHSIDGWYPHFRPLFNLQVNVQNCINISHTSLMLLVTRKESSSMS